jgi:hypothetical protein
MTNNEIKMNIVEKLSVWNIKNDGLFKSSIYNHLLNDGITENGVDAIFENANDILLHCPNPLYDTKLGKTGIVIGKVQSGKTSNFISTIALAFDNGYNISVVLGGNKKNLASQNATRIKESFSGCGSKLAVLSTEQNIDLLNEKNIQDFLDSGKKIIIVGLKHQKHIKMIKDLFENTALASIPTLIVDDEGDQASLNTKAFSKTKGESSIYASIKSLKAVIDVHCFLSITATPQANILIPQISVLSPDFGVLVYPGSDYCGLNDFHGIDSKKHIKIILATEQSLLDGSVVPASFYKALASFFVGGAIRRNRGEAKFKKQKHSMLIHPSLKKPDHKIVLSKVEAVLNKWKDISKLELKNIHDMAYKPIRQHLLNAYDVFKADGVQVPEFNDIEKDILLIIRDCSPVFLCNSDSDASSNEQYYDCNIFLGGNMVERGLTFKGLAVTYIIRRAKGISNVDNTEQRARWFGYKRDYFDVCQVYTTEDIARDFSDILDHDNDLWSTIERAQARGVQFKDMPRIFKLGSSKLRLTRKNVAQSDSFSFPEWTKEGKFLFDKESCTSNKSTIDNFINDNSSLMKPMIIGGYENPKYQIIENYDLNKLFDNVIKKLIFIQDAGIDKTDFASLIEVFEKMKISVPIDIVFIRYPDYDSREIYEDGSINQLFQGHGTRYPGDSALPNEKQDAIQLQIHFIAPNNKPEIDYKTLALALYIPTTLSEQTGQFVGRAKND